MKYYQHHARYRHHRCVLNGRGRPTTTTNTTNTTIYQQPQPPVSSWKLHIYRPVPPQESTFTVPSRREKMCLPSPPGAKNRVTVLSVRNVYIYLPSRRENKTSTYFTISSHFPAPSHLQYFPPDNLKQSRPVPYLNTVLSLEKSNPSLRGK